MLKKVVEAVRHSPTLESGKLFLALRHKMCHHANSLFNTRWYSACWTLTLTDSARNKNTLGCECLGHLGNLYDFAI